MASGTMKRQNGHFIRVESTMNVSVKQSTPTDYGVDCFTLTVEFPLYFLKNCSVK